MLNQQTLQNIFEHLNVNGFEPFARKSSPPSRADAISRAMNEALEPRRFLSAAPTPGAFPESLEPLGMVYSLSNNPNAGENAVLAYRRTDSGLELVDSYPTFGTGFLNDDNRLGPQDNDRPIIVNKDRTLLFAVDGASNRITSFRINTDGTLARVPGGRVSSGGVFPVSLEQAGSTLWVLNKGTAGPFEPAGSVETPNITVFHVLNDGRLTVVQQAAVTFSTATGSSPSQVLASPDGRTLFADRLFIAPTPPPGEENQLDAFAIEPVMGTLTRVSTPAGPNNLPALANPAIEGLATHPTARIVYGGLPLANGISTFTYDNSGALTYVGSAPNSGVETCWLTVDRDGSHLYTSNSQSNTVTVYSLEDPLAPVQVQILVLAPPRQAPGQGNGRFASLPHQFALDPTGERLYVVNQQSTADDSFPEGNNMHILDVGADGLLSETIDPLIFSQTLVPTNAHPQGVVAV